MKYFKSIEHLRKRAIANNGEKVNIWDDDGINIDGKAYFMQEYGGGFKKDEPCHVSFRNLGRRGRHNGLSEPYGLNEGYITIKYNLLFNEKEKTNNIFEFLGVD